ncbi:hypothetical protein MBLNU459_g5054t2 [Dothideomycetes sp. NU459]
MSGHYYYSNNPGSEYVPAQHPYDYDPSYPQSQHGPSAPSEQYSVPRYQPHQYEPPAQDQYSNSPYQQGGYPSGPDPYQQSPAPDHYPRDGYSQQNTARDAPSVSPVPGYGNQVAYVPDVPGAAYQPYSGYAPPPQPWSQQPPSYGQQQQQQPQPQPYGQNQSYYQGSQFEQEPSHDRNQKAGHGHDRSRDQRRQDGRDAQPGQSGGSGGGNPLSNLSEGERGLGASLLGGASGALLGHEMGGGALATIGGLIAGAIGANVLEKNVLAAGKYLGWMDEWMNG